MYSGSVGIIIVVILSLFVVLYSHTKYINKNEIETNTRRKI